MRPRHAPFHRLGSTLLAPLVLAATLAGAALAAPPRTIPGELIVKYRPGVTLDRRTQALERLPLAQRLHDFAFIRAEHIRFSGMSTEQAIATLEADPGVEYAEPNYVITADVIPNDPRFPELYAMRNTGQTGGTAGADIRATAAWDVYTGDPNVKVGVIDTGIDYNHPDLAANVWTNPGEIAGNSVDDDGNGYVDDVHGYDFVNNDGDPMDDHGHGSHCSGTIAGVGNNGVGVTGVSWQAKLVGIKFLNAGGSGSTEGAISGIQYAIAVGVQLTSNSWGGGGFSQALLDAINAAGAAGQLFIAAAGNDGSNNDSSPHYPSTYDTPYIVAVAATDDNDQLASFSNYGLTTVDLGAPGVDILSCQPGGGYQLLSGTSMATPHVSGAAALAFGRFPNATNLQIKQLLMLKADPIPALAGRVVTGARLNAFLAIADPDSIPPDAVADLAAVDPGSTTMGLAWTATGDDGPTGRASRYDIRWSTSPIDDTNFATATPVVGPDPQTAGSAETFEVPGLTYNTLYYFAMKVADEFGNTGPISNVASGTTLGIPNLSVSPPSLTETLLTGATSDQVLTVSNTGAGRLDWTAPTPELLLGRSLVAIEAAPVQQAIALGKDDLDPRPGILGAGGPDAFGYRWVDSDDPGGPAFGWVDITGVGTALALTGDDALSAPVAMGMTFPFYGNGFTDVRICTNGFLSFTDGVFPYTNSALPNASGAQNMVAPFWDDLNFGTTPRVYTHYDGARFIVTWADVPHYSSGGPYTFQAILYPSGEIRYQYRAMASPTNSATVGIQNATETVGLTAAFNTTFVRDSFAVRIIPLRQWLTVAPASGRLTAGNSEPVTVHFDASGLNGGVYDGNVRFLSNDPDDSPKLVPAELTVIGAPNLVAAPETTAFGQRYVGGTYTRTLVVSNNGTDVLHVTGITATGDGLSAAPGAFDLAPSAAQNVTVTWNPSAIAPLAGTLDVASDDPDQPVKTVLVTGNSVAAPSFAVDPTSLEETLNTNTASSRNLRVTNSGGSNLDFTAGVVLAPGPGPSARAVASRPSAFVGKGEPDVEAGPAPDGAGGPDAFGYRWADGNEPGGPAFAWVEIESVGTEVPFNTDDQNLGPFNIGFSFPFYGTTFSSFRMCTNGWISFTSSATVYSNSTLPNTASGTPENLIAPFWDDLTFSSTGSAWYHNDGTRMIIEWKDAPRLAESPVGNTFQVQLYPDGRILCQYLAMNTTTRNTHTIGIQNATKTDGLQVVYNNAGFLANNLALRFDPPARFLSVTPPSGSVPPGGFVDLTVGFNAAGLYGGDYAALVRLGTNDPIVPQYDVPALLHVIGVPDIVVTPTSLAFDTTFIGSPHIRQLTVQNTGTSSLIVDEFTFDEPAYSTATGGVTLPPAGSTIVSVGFGPTAAQDYPGTLTIKSNDPDTPFLAVPLSGMGAVAPDQNPTQTSFALTVPPGGNATRDLVLQNLGGSNLYWTIGASVSAAAATHYGSLALGKNEKDPRPGILGSGGPDAYGYRWKDSDEPGGPAFSWVDITGVGTQIGGFAADDRTKLGVAIGFPFTFYGNTFTEVNVCTNGWLSFTDTDSAYTNQPLPNTGSRVPPNLVAPFWDDLDLRGSGTVWYHKEATRFIVSWIAAPHLTSGGPYTFQVILHSNGKIVYQYLSMATPTNSATVGIQNAARDVGLQAVYNAAYVHDGLAVQFSAMPTWLVAASTAGTVPPGGSSLIPLEISTAGLEMGTYQGNVRISSNDPDEGLTDIPVTLTVGQPVAVGDALPKSYGLRMASPNPATRRASLDLALPESGTADVAIYDVRGALVRQLARGPMEAGVHRLRWDGDHGNGAPVHAGIYFVRATTRGGTFRQRIVMLP